MIILLHIIRRFKYQIRNKKTYKNYINSVDKRKARCYLNMRKVLALDTKEC